jgi:hypothetical protein
VGAFLIPEGQFKNTGSITVEGTIIAARATLRGSATYKLSDCWVHTMTGPFIDSTPVTWTEVAERRTSGAVERRRMEDDRKAAAGFRGVRYRKLAEAVRRSCGSAESYATALLRRPGVVGVELTEVVERRARHTTHVEIDREPLLRAWVAGDGSVEVAREGCAR